MRPILFELPWVGAVTSFQVLLALAFASGIGLAFLLKRQIEGDGEVILDMSLLAVLGGIFGSRIFYWFEFYDRYFDTRPWYEIFYVHQGGFVFYGGFLAATLSIAAYLLWLRARGRNVRVLETLDCIVPGLALAHAVGRVGCFLNGCCWGAIDQGRALYAVTFPPGSHPFERHVALKLLPETALESLPVHATQLYSVAGNLILCAVLLLVWRFVRRDGVASALYLILYPPLRFVIESFRQHDPVHEMRETSLLGTVTYSQLVSLSLLAIGVVWLVLAASRGPRSRPRAPERIFPGGD